MNLVGKNFSLNGCSAQAPLAYALAANIENCFSFSVKQNSFDCGFTAHLSPLCEHTFMLTLDVTLDTLYHLSEDAMRRLGDAVFTVVGFVRQRGAKSQRQVRRFAQKANAFVMPIVGRVVNLRL